MNMRKGVIESIYHNFKLKCLNSYGFVFPEYISEFANQLKKCKQDSHVLVCGQNGCIDSKTQIFVDRKRKQIKNAPNIFTTKIYDEKNKMFIDSTAIKIKTGKQKVYRIKLRDGKEIMATADHRWLTTEGWKKTIDLGKGENIISYDGR